MCVSCIVPDIALCYNKNEVMNVPASKAQQKAVAKYMKDNYDELKVRVGKGARDKIKAHAETLGLSLNGYINKLIEEDMKKATPPE